MNLTIIEKLDRKYESFGFLPFCLLIKEFENKGDYKKCQLLKDTIDRKNKYYKDLFGDEYEAAPTVYGNKAIVQMKKGLERFGFTGDVIMNNLPYYAEEIKLELI